MNYDDYVQVVYNIHQSALVLRDKQANERKQLNNQVIQHLSWADDLIPADWYNNMMMDRWNSDKIVLYYR